MRPASRFPVKLAGVSLLLLSVAGMSSVLIALRLFDRRQIEIDQRLNAGIAASMAAELEPVIGAARDRGCVSYQAYADQLCALANETALVPRAPVRAFARGGPFA